MGLNLKETAVEGAKDLLKQAVISFCFVSNCCFEEFVQ